MSKIIVTGALGRMGSITTQKIRENLTNMNVSEAV